MHKRKRSQCAVWVENCELLSVENIQELKRQEWKSEYKHCHQV